MKIAVVDDDKAICEAIAQLIKESGVGSRGVSVFIRKRDAGNRRKLCFIFLGYCQGRNVWLRACGET